MLHTLPYTPELAGLDGPALRRAITSRLRGDECQLSRNKVLCLARDGARCQWPGCGAPEGLTIHHVKPRSAGGGHALRNLITLCEAHHEAIHEAQGVTPCATR